MTILAEQRSYVAGRWITGDDVVSVENPADESHVADITATPLAEVQRAIDAARRSFDEGAWAETAPTERARVLRAFIDHIEAARDELVPTLVAEAGQSTFFADYTQLRAGATIGRQTIELFLSMSHEQASPVPVDELVRGPSGAQPSSP